MLFQLPVAHHVHDLREQVLAMGQNGTSTLALATIPLKKGMHAPPQTGSLPKLFIGIKQGTSSHMLRHPSA